MFKKALMILLTAAFIAAPAFAGNIPEFDTVGDDSNNIFNDAIRDMVVANVTRGLLPGDFVLINEDSDFPYNEVTDYGEYFQAPCVSFSADACFWNLDEEGQDPYKTCMVCPYSGEKTFKWQIVLQLMPESEIDLNIRDCVMKHNAFCVWTGAEQTGRYRTPWGQLAFDLPANPSISVVCKPGPCSANGFDEPLTMDALTHPNLVTTALEGNLYTSKALWSEGIVLSLPEEGVASASGVIMHQLNQGDQIEVTITVPHINTADIRYGSDNVSLEYVGVVGTGIVASDLQ